MPSASVTALIPTIVFWALMVPIGGYIFQFVCNLCGADAPSFRRSMIVTVLVSAVAFFTFDGMGYGIIMASRDTIQLNLPPRYSYWNWLREPLALKWQALGLIPLIRYLPLLCAVCLAATLYVLILSEPFRNCIAIMAIQWTLNVAAMAVLSFLLSTTLGFLGQATTEPSKEMRQGPPGIRPEPRAHGHRNRQRRPEQPTGKEEPGSDLRSILASHSEKERPNLHNFRQQLRAYDQYLEPIKTASALYTKQLPPVVQAFLDDGGWWAVLAALALAVAFWLRALGRRLRRILFPRRRHLRKQRGRDKASPLAIDLDLVGDAFTDPGPQQITVRGQTGRLRLVILAPSPSYVGDLLPEMAESLLDWLQPGLGEILEADSPRRVVWPRHPSLDRFVSMFHQLIEIPEVKGRRSPWVLISGSAHLGRQTVYVGLAVFLDKTGYQRELQVVREKWSEILGIQKVTEPV